MLESDDATPFTVNLAGIESPGPACALPLARRAVSILKEKGNPALNPAFNPCCGGIRNILILEQEKSLDGIQLCVKTCNSLGDAPVRI